MAELCLFCGLRPTPGTIEGITLAVGQAFGGALLLGALYDTLRLRTPWLVGLQLFLGAGFLLFYAGPT